MVKSPPCPECFLVPFVIDYRGMRFGKYPLGFPAVLSLGERLGIRHLVNPFLSSFSIWLIYLLGRRIFGRWTALFAAFLTLSSPFFLMNSPSLLSHPFSLFLSLAFILAWLDFVDSESKISPWITLPTAGLTLGLLILTRPLTAVGVALPFIIHGTILFIRGNHITRSKLVIYVFLVSIFACLHFLWQAAVTGDPFLNPYTLWWSYDTIGFGPGHGIQAGGYKLIDLFSNIGINLYTASLDVHGWAGLSWLFLPAGIIAIWQNKKAWLICSVFPSLVFAYSFYWIGSWLLGPRYYYEGLPAWIYLTSAGIFWIARKAINRWQYSGRWLFGLLIGSVLLLTSLNFRYYIPIRVLGLHGLYGARQERLIPFQQPGTLSLAPALFVVSTHTDWIEYGSLIDLSSPFNDSPFLFTIDLGMEGICILSDAFPERYIYLYDPDTPFTFTLLRKH